MFRIWMCACFLSASVGLGSRILVVYPVPDAAHAALGDAVVRTLLAADHVVTYVSVFPKKSLNPNLTYVDISSILSEHSGKTHDSSRHWSNGRSANDIFGAGPQFAQDALHDQTFKELLHDSTLTFDALVVDWFYSGLLAPLASLYECPLIWYTSEDISWQNLKLVHEEPSPAYSVSPLAREMPSLPFTVKERLYQLGMQIYINLWSYYTTHFVELPAYDAIYRTPFQLRQRLLPNYGEVVHNGSLLLVNSHPPLGQMLPVPQNAKLIGGHHIRQPIKPLPKMLQLFLNNAKNGVIYMNIPHLQGKLPKKLQEQLLDALGQLEQLVLWQYSGSVEYVPRNVRVMERAPQLSILNHPNTKIFISDGSLSSLIEATHCGVPIVAVPTAAGQGVNVDLMVTRGLGHRVDLDQYLPWKLQGAVAQIIGNQSYLNNAQQASVVFHRRITPANDELISWVNLVISTRGAAHLRSPAVQVPVLERYHMDLWILLVLALWFLSKVMKVIQVHLKDLKKKNQ